MYPYLIFFHSCFRWLVLAGLLTSIYRAYSGYTGHKPFTRTDNSVRHWTATLTHIQLMLGLVLYFTSPVTQYFLKNTKEALQIRDITFFGLIHISVMVVSVLLVTVGSAMAKRQETDRDKFRTMLIWYGVALLLIFVAIPWPFSPLANRPYFRTL